MPDTAHTASPRSRPEPETPSWRAIAPIDIGLFVRSARSDARLGRMIGAGAPPAEAFDRLYAEADGNDPWASASPRYGYQRRKYDGIVALLPEHARYRRSLDLGCGAGLLTNRLLACSDTVLGLDISAVAVAHASDRAAGTDGPRFQQADMLDLDPALDRRFDLVVVADALYYLPPAAQTDAGLKAIATRLARLLTPDGTLLIANHYVSGFDAESRRSRRIHNAFTWSPSLDHQATHRRPFWLGSILHPALSCRHPGDSDV
jgi:SAM-dependent methyltransferase